MRKRTWILCIAGGLFGAAALFVEWQMGWDNVIGMLRYDTRREGDLNVGDLAPAVVLHDPFDGAAKRFFDTPPTRPVVLVFGSFT